MNQIIRRHLDVTSLTINETTLLLVALWAFSIFWTLKVTLTSTDTKILFSRRFISFFHNTELSYWYLNSLITSSSVTAIVIGISSACGYAISQIEFDGRKVIWYVTLGSFLVPVQALIVNHFFIIYEWGLLNTWLGVILPQLITPMAVIVYKQFFDVVPKDLSAAAIIDGASHWHIFWYIYLPLNWGVTIAMAIIVFIAAWNAFLWPFLAVTKSEFMNVTVGIAQLRSYGISNLTTSIMAGLPTVIIYLLFQRKITEAISVSVSIKYKR